MEDWAAIDGWIEGIRAALPALELHPTKTVSSASKEGDDTSEGLVAKQRKQRCTKTNPFMATVTRVVGLCTLVEPGRAP